MSEKLIIKGQLKSSEILLGESLDRLKDFCHPDKTVLIIDKNVYDLHIDKLFQAPKIQVEAKESNKTLATVGDIYHQFINLEVDRSWFVVGIGGGITLDIAGFVASTYMRGLSFGFAPTTLLAQADAGVGGKNGVNLDGYKNMIGNFNQPDFVLYDFEVLKTLPKIELGNGFAEIIKHALINDKEYFSFLNEHKKDLLELRPDLMHSTIKRSVEIKAYYVNQDETEQGIRKILNFGHTLAHAIEKTTQLNHGQAVAIGMVFASRLSESKGYITKEDTKQITDLIASYNLPTMLKTDPEVITKAMLKDKKRAGTYINYILLRSIGSSFVEKIEENDLERILNDLC